MQFSKGRFLLLSALAASLIFSLLTGLAARHYYIEAKLRGVEPAFTHHFRQQNSTLSVAPGHQLVTLFGDSRIADWNPVPRAEGYAVVRRGIGGESTAQMLYRYQSDVLALRPKAVIIQAGINDLVAAGLDPEAEDRVFQNAVANLETMVTRARIAGIQVILLTIIPPSAPGIFRRLVWSDRIPLLVERTNRKLVPLHAPPWVHVIDTRRVLQTDLGDWKPDVNLDTLHLTPAGYAELNIAVIRVLANL